MKKITSFLLIVITILPTVLSAQVQVRNPDYVPDAMRDYIACPACGELVAPTLEVCPHCGKILYYRRLIIIPGVGMTHYNSPSENIPVSLERNLFSFGGGMLSFNRLMLTKSEIAMALASEGAKDPTDFFMLKGKYELSFFLNRGRRQFFLGGGLYAHISRVSNLTEEGAPEDKTSDTWTRLYLYPTFGLKVSLPERASFINLFVSYLLAGFSFGGGEETLAFFGNTLEAGGMLYIEFSRHWGLSARGEIMSDFSSRMDPDSEGTDFDYLIMGGPAIHF